MLGLNLLPSLLHCCFLGSGLSPPQRVRVVVYGGSGTGKKSLISTLNNRVYCCPQDGRRLLLEVQLGDGLSQASVAMILLDARKPEIISLDTIDVARRIAISTCVVHTKLDLVPCDYSDPHLRFLASRPLLSHRLDVDCLSVNLKTGEGIDDILAFIGHSVAGFSAAPRPPRITSFFRRLWSQLLDCIAACFALPLPGPPLDVSAELAPLTSDSDVVNLMDQPLDTAWGEELKRRLGAEDAPYVTVNKISPSLIVKDPSGSERASMALVREKTTIPIPRDLCPHLSCLVMDFIDGEMLYECWDRLSRFMQFRVACTLRRYTKQLRSLTRPAPGGLGDGCVRGVVFSDSVYGPFPTARSFRQFCELVAFRGWRAKAVRAIEAKEAIPPLPRPDLIDWAMPAFVHGDLNLSNVMLDRQGSLWIIDWANAGYYPPSMESIAMRRVDEIMHAEDVSSSWRRYRSFVAGTVPTEEEAFWDDFVIGSVHFPGNPC
ncbi:hypothetical protein GSI_14633 [Ganoderma sinense ZZ0214-1]|uniref:Aminoglycoside phosphotransferase domain-containing protein n=1 Tax=Ganoderma sinense ZZ0214-1 TaxID=1077348 RepID=A0A2G8RP87_9APHY|nr:hypothetical protein GSI_14633 [Ganoderma sinense ZZ0214-1]